MATPLPPPLKKIQPYVAISKQFTKRDPVVAYYVKMYAIQEGMDAGRDSASKGYLLSLMDEVEELKSRLKTDPEQKDKIVNEVIGQSHVEDTALKIFDFADTRDRNSEFTKPVIKSFYTSSHLLTCLKQFGELDEEIEKKMKYAKWKAVEIDRCLKNGITPTPGPPGEFEDGFGEPTPGGFPMLQPNMGGGGGANPGPSSSYYAPSEPSQDRPVPMPRSNVPHSMPPAPSDLSSFPTGNPYPPTNNPYPPTNNPYPSYPPPPSSEGGGAYPGMGTTTSGGGYYTGGGSSDASGSGYNSGGSDPVASGGGGGGGGGRGVVKLGPDQVVSAQKYCKFASSALDYDDSEGAIDYLTKALKLLKTGKDD